MTYKMVYTVSSSERLRPSGAEYETKALLYLMNFRDDSNDVYYYVVDFFNDLTGMDRMGNRLWDLQSKGAKNNSPKAIGKELITLFKNYRSQLEFQCYLLFLGGVSNTVRINNELHVFDINNIKASAKEKIIEGLLEEAQDKTYIDNSIITEDEIEDFLSKVQFIVDDKNISEYVKSIIEVHSAIIPSDEMLIAIFNEIRDEQSSKKNNSVVENITIQTSVEALDYYRHLTAGEIKLLVLGRIINRNPFEKGVPIAFMETLNRAPADKRKNMLEDCQLSLSRALFNKNQAEAFWKLFENIYKIIINKPNFDIGTIFQLLDRDLKERNTDFNAVSLKYFISIVKDGVQV